MQSGNEVEVLATAGVHPNLVPFRGWYVDSSNILCLVLGHCEGGTLASLLKVSSAWPTSLPAQSCCLLVSVSVMHLAFFWMAGECVWFGKCHVAKPALLS
jgi:serine/threonine protein kinase